MESREKRKLFNKFSKRFKRLKQRESLEIRNINKKSFCNYQSSSSQVSTSECQGEDYYIHEHLFELSSPSDKSLARTPDSFSNISDENNSINYGPPLLVTETNRSTPNFEQVLTLEFSLANWAVTHNINHLALSSLLDILRINNPELPKDPRTLLKTPRHTGSQIKIVEPGFYYHFGLTRCLENLLVEYLKENTFDSDVLEICVNLTACPFPRVQEIKCGL